MRVESAIVRLDITMQQGIYSKLESWAQEISRGKYSVNEVLEVVAEQLARDPDLRHYVGVAIRPQIWQPGEATD